MTPCSAGPACRGRVVHVAADTAYICTELRSLPAGVTLTGPLPRHASLYQVHPELDCPPARGRRRGRPRTKGPRIGTPAQLAAAGPGRAATVTRYGTTASVTICERRCLWPGVFRSRPVRVIAVTDPGSRLTIFNSGGYCCRFAVAGGHEVSRWRRPGRGGTGPPGAGAAGRRGDDRGRGRRPGGREAVPGVADVGEPVAAGPGRRWPGGAGLQGGGRRAVQAHSRPAGRAGGGAGCGPGGGRLCGSVLDAGRDRGPGVAAVRGGVHAGRDGCAAAPARLERAGPGPPGRRAGRGQDRRLAGGDLAGGKRTAADLGAWLVFEDESGQGLRPPKGRTWGRRGQTPVVRVTGSSNRRVSVAALICVKPGQRPRLIYRTHPGRRHRPGQRKGF